MKYELPSTAEEIQPKKSSKMPAFAMIGVCLVIGAVCGLALISGLEQSGNKKPAYSKKQDRGQSFVNWLVGSDSKSKKKSKGKSSYSRFSKTLKPIKTDFKVSSPFSKPRPTIILD